MPTPAPWIRNFQTNRGQECGSRVRMKNQGQKCARPIRASCRAAVSVASGLYIRRVMRQGRGKKFPLASLRWRSCVYTENGMSIGNVWALRDFGLRRHAPSRGKFAARSSCRNGSGPRLGNLPESGAPAFCSLAGKFSAKRRPGLGRHGASGAPRAAEWPRFNVTYRWVWASDLADKRMP